MPKEVVVGQHQAYAALSPTLAGQKAGYIQIWSRCFAWWGRVNYV